MRCIICKDANPPARLKRSPMAKTCGPVCGALNLANLGAAARRRFYRKTADAAKTAKATS